MLEAYRESGADLLAEMEAGCFADEPFEAPAATDGLYRLMVGSLATDWDFPYERLDRPTLVLTGDHDRLFRIDAEGNETEISTKGRHDPCVGIRAVPIGEAMMALVLADHYLRHRGQVGGT